MVYVVGLMSEWNGVGWDRLHRASKWPLLVIVAVPSQL